MSGSALIFVLFPMNALRFPMAVCASRRQDAQVYSLGRNASGADELAL